MNKPKSNGNLILAILVLSVVSILLLSGCKVTTPPAGGTGTYTPPEIFEPKNEIAVKSFQSVDEFNSFVKGISGGYGSYGGFDRMLAETANVAPSLGAASGIMAKSSAPIAGTDFSPTNNQIASVDEADLIKTDGNYIYTISGNTLFIVKAYPGEEAEIVATINLSARNYYYGSSPTSLFINGNHLAVFGDYYNPEFFKKVNFVPRQGMTFFNIYDISDKENPKLVKEYKFEGRYFQARMIDDYVYFVVTSGPEYRIELPTPVIIEGTAKRSIPVSDVYYYPIPYQNPEFATIHAIKLASPNEEINSKTVAVEGSQNMYMSEKNIYITYTEYINEWDLTKKITMDLMMDKLTDADKQLIEKIKQTDNDVLSQYEKENKILQIMSSYASYLTSEEQDKLQEQIQLLLQKKLSEYDYMEYTVINKISVDNGNIGIKANGKVPGHIMNQFSLDEKEDILRIATTVSQRWSSIRPLVAEETTLGDIVSGEQAIQESKPSPTIVPQRTESTNHIFALDSDLKIIGSLKDLAEGEQIYSTRFIGDRLYMVTFRQVDPFFVIDLSNPRNIKELGKLKIPGFSRYLHPYDENIIIGLGREATEQGGTQGLKISLFDVSDVENPKEIAKFVSKEQYAQSTAEFEHKAFLFSKEKELLVIPAYNYEYRFSGESTSQGYNGAMVFKITKDSIELRGIIDHSAGNDQYYYGPRVERSLYIKELLYTKSPDLLRINKIDDLSKVKNIELKDEGGPYPVY